MKGNVSTMIEQSSRVHIDINLPRIIDVTANATTVYAPVDVTASIINAYFNSTSGIGYIVYRTTAIFPYRLTPPMQVKTTPGGVTATMQDPQDSSCPTWSDSDCVQTWVMEVVPQDTCSFSGAYTPSLTISCREGMNCPALVSPFADLVSSVISGTTCGELVLSDRPSGSVTSISIVSGSIEDPAGTNPRVYVSETMVLRFSGTGLEDVASSGQSPTCFIAFKAGTSSAYDAVFVPGDTSRQYIARTAYFVSGAFECASRASFSEWQTVDAHLAYISSYSPQQFLSATASTVGVVARAPLATSFTFNAACTSLVVELSAASVFASGANDTVPCSLLLDTPAAAFAAAQVLDSMAMDNAIDVGTTAASCQAYFASSTRLVLAPSGAFVASLASNRIPRPGAFALFRPGVLIAAGTPPSHAEPFVGGLASLIAPANPAPLVAAFDLPASLPACASATLSALRSPVGTIPFKRVAFELDATAVRTRMLAANIPLESVGEAVISQVAALLANNATIFTRTIPSNTLVGGVAYPFSITLENVCGAVGIVSADMAVGTVGGAPSVQLLATQLGANGIQFEASVTSAQQLGCTGTLPALIAEYRWSIERRLANGTVVPPGPPSTGASSLFVVRASEASAGDTLTATCAMYSATGQLIASSLASTVLRGVAPSPHFVSGQRISVPSGTGVADLSIAVEDMSRLVVATSDAQQLAPLYAFAWTCTTAGGSPCVETDGETPLVIPAVSNPQLQVAGLAIATGGVPAFPITVRVTVTPFAGGADLASSASATVQLSSLPPLPVT